MEVDPDERFWQHCSKLYVFHAKHRIVYVFQHVRFEGVARLLSQCIGIVMLTSHTLWVHYR